MHAPYVINHSLMQAFLKSIKDITVERNRSRAHFVVNHFPDQAILVGIKKLTMESNLMYADRYYNKYFVSFHCLKELERAILEKKHSHCSRTISRSGDLRKYKNGRKTVVLLSS